ncbi:MAG: CHAD domain-containing protein [Phycisphaeraceae bacterium]|nr:CHAD domain-containing protein [Phycisphaeraceae bacterium]
MAFRFGRREEIGVGVRRVALEQLGKAADALARTGEDHERAVHEARKCITRARSALRLVRHATGDAFGAVNARLREAARSLSTSRDAAVTLAAFDALARDAEGVERVRERLAGGAWQDPALPCDETIARAFGAIEAARDEIEAMRFSASGFELVEPGLRRAWRRARRAMRAATEEQTDERLHEWRKGCKVVHAHAKLLRRVRPKEMERLVTRLRDLCTALGEERDLALLVDRLESIGEDDGAIGALIEEALRRRDVLRVRAFALGETVFERSARRMARRTARLYDGWERDG